jgi:endonuclease/exonuclease/phosphatase family metal-dependent hydrolase
MTYNIKGHGALLRGRHIERVAEVIRETAPDVVGIQEVHRRGWKARFHDQAAQLEELTGMHLHFGCAMANGETEYGNALLTRGDIVEAHVESLPGGGEPRALLAAKVEVRGTRFLAYVTHLAAWGRFGARKRLMQAQAVAARVAASDLPYVLMGDFNSSPSSAELRVFHDGSLVTSCFMEDVVTHRATRQCLDYIFVAPQWRIGNARVVTRGPSDHWPLLAELEQAS